ncbi:MAG: hypothetical protein PVF74_05800 [Anaerolineales bacterium]|jgi:hypothetical protein
MANPRRKTATIFLILLTGLLLWSCSSTATPETTVIVTVVETMPIEVTRLVEITREVMVTEIVEVPVTVTPQPPTATSDSPTPTDTPIAPTLPSIVDPLFGVTPEGRVHGWLPFFVENKTSEKLEIFVDGPIPFNRVVYAGGSQKVWLREGSYTFSVWGSGSLKYNGTFRLTIDEKHHLFLRDDKPKLWVP